MAIKAIEKECRSLWSAVVKLRDGACLACLLSAELSTTLESHHLVFRAQGDWRVQFDPDFGVTLCGWHHRQGPQAPHQNNNRFEADILPAAILLMDEERQGKVQAYLESPSPPAKGFPNFEEIRKQLRKLIVELENDYYCDADIDQPDVGWRPS